MLPILSRQINWSGPETGRRNESYVQQFWKTCAPKAVSSVAGFQNRYTPMDGLYYSFRVNNREEMYFISLTLLQRIAGLSYPQQ
jgi:hypothetical protein